MKLPLTSVVGSASAHEKDRPYVVVVAMDFGHAAVRGVEVAMRAAARHERAQVHLVGVVGPFSSFTALSAEAALDALLDRLAAVAREVRRHRSAPVISHACMGAPAQEILGVAREVGADLLVLGTAGPRGLGRLLRGSIASHVIESAPCPVLTIHPARLVPAA